MSKMQKAEVDKLDIRSLREITPIGTRAPSNLRWSELRWGGPERTGHGACATAENCPVGNTKRGAREG
jgi:hypothetical protein